MVGLIRSAQGEAVRDNETGLVWAGSSVVAKYDDGEKAKARKT
jgi:hypothetical protein